MCIRDSPKAEEMYQYGVVAEIKQVMRVSDDLVRILVEGKFRATRTELDTEGSFLLASVRPAPVRQMCIRDRPCTAQDPCADNSPVQTDDETYEIAQE